MSEDNNADKFIKVISTKSFVNLHASKHCSSVVVITICLLIIEV